MPYFCERRHLVFQLATEPPLFPAPVSRFQSLPRSYSLSPSPPLATGLTLPCSSLPVNFCSLLLEHYPVISAYLNRASTSFNELNQLHKQLKSSRFPKTHKRNRTKISDDVGRVKKRSVRNFVNNHEMHNWHVQSKNDFKRDQFCSETADKGDEKSMHTVVNFCREPSGSVEYHAGSVGWSKKKQEVESRDHGDSRDNFVEREGEHKLLIGAQNEIEAGRDGKTRMKNGRK